MSDTYRVGRHVPTHIYRADDSRPCITVINGSDEADSKLAALIVGILNAQEKPAEPAGEWVDEA